MSRKVVFAAAAVGVGLAGVGLAVKLVEDARRVDPKDSGTGLDEHQIFGKRDASYGSPLFI